MDAPVRKDIGEEFAREAQDAPARALATGWAVGYLRCALVVGWTWVALWLGAGIMPAFASGTWTPTGNMNEARNWTTATLLPNGRCWSQGL